ncbi:hypothetical protein NLI96_g5625 [Meripilus lineatus]|uniref:Uncharacterized protein n=1 Tax=Meripilus lineatus TaxID=2056292 RepID=A0AAD5YGR9_9APHY|nr:hypothetical protein NLI96_g5625 [Physisporinus lineatus]
MQYPQLPPPHAPSSTAETTTRAPRLRSPSNEHSFTLPYAPTSTPPPLVGRAQSLSQQSDMRFRGNTTPKGQPHPLSSRTGDPSTPHPPSDTEAADLMLLFATSPSPLRPAALKDREARDKAAFHTLSELIGDTSPPGSQERVIGIPVRPPPLNTGNEHSREGRRAEVPNMPNVIPPTPTDQSPAQILSAHRPQSPDRSYTHSSNNPESMEHSPSLSSDLKSSLQAPPTPGSTFNFRDFINVSPSPATAPPTSKLSSNMRTDVGRRLFEEHHSGSVDSHDGVSTPHDSSLGAGIDLMSR